MLHCRQLLSIDVNGMLLHAMRCNDIPLHGMPCHGMPWHARASHARACHAIAVHHPLPFIALYCNPLRPGPCIAVGIAVHPLPSALLSMRAKKPSGWSCRHALRSDCSLWRASDMSEEDTQLRPVLKRTGSHTVSVEIITWSDHSARGGGVTGRKHRTTLTLEKGEEALPCAPTRTFQTPASMLHHPNTMPQNFRARLQLTVACRRAPRSFPSLLPT